MTICHVKQEDEKELVFKLGFSELFEKNEFYFSNSPHHPLRGSFPQRGSLP